MARMKTAYGFEVTYLSPGGPFNETRTLRALIITGSMDRVHKALKLGAKRKGIRVIRIISIVELSKVGV